MAFTTSVVGSRSTVYMRRVRQAQYSVEKTQFLEKLKLAQQNTPVESLAYLVGLIDGEGTISFTFSNRPKKLKSHTISSQTVRPYLHIANTNRSCLEFAKKTLGFGKIRSKSPRKPKWSMSWHYTVLGLGPLATALYLVKPYLLVKKKSAELVYEYCLSRLFTVHPRPSFSKRWYSDRETKIVEEVKLLQK